MRRQRVETAARWPISHTPRLRAHLFAAAGGGTKAVGQESRNCCVGTRSPWTSGFACHVHAEQRINSAEGLVGVTFGVPDRRPVLIPGARTGHRGTAEEERGPGAARAEQARLRALEASCYDPMPPSPGDPGQDQVVSEAEVLQRADGVFRLACLVLVLAGIAWLGHGGTSSSNSSSGLSQRSAPRPAGRSPGTKARRWLAIPARAAVRRGRLRCPSGESVAARHEREHKRPVRRYLSKGSSLFRPHPRRSSSDRGPPQQPARRSPWRAWRVSTCQRRWMRPGRGIQASAPPWALRPSG